MTNQLQVRTDRPSLPLPVSSPPPQPRLTSTGVPTTRSPCSHLGKPLTSTESLMAQSHAHLRNLAPPLHPKALAHPQATPPTLTSTSEKTPPPPTGNLSQFQQHTGAVHPPIRHKVSSDSSHSLTPPPQQGEELSELDCLYRASLEAPSMHRGSSHTSPPPPGPRPGEGGQGTLLMMCVCSCV